MAQFWVVGADGFDIWMHPSDDPTAKQYPVRIFADPEDRCPQGAFIICLLGTGLLPGLPGFLEPRRFRQICCFFGPVQVCACDGRVS